MDLIEKIKLIANLIEYNYMGILKRFKSFMRFFMINHIFYYKRDQTFKDKYLIAYKSDITKYQKIHLNENDIQFSILYRQRMS